jgi:hypothetical protein
MFYQADLLPLLYDLSVSTQTGFVLSTVLVHGVHLMINPEIKISSRQESIVSPSVSNGRNNQSKDAAPNGV